MKYFVLTACVLCAFFLSGCSLLKKKEVPPPPPTPVAEEGFRKITAQFDIYTLGTKRIFTSSMYHNRSAEVFITKSDPRIVHVQAKGIIWYDFFVTLPFSLNEECLITGTAQQFCTGDQGTLRFYLNGVDTPDALSREIKQDDYLVVKFE